VVGDRYKVISKAKYGKVISKAKYGKVTRL